MSIRYRGLSGMKGNTMQHSKAGMTLSNSSTGHSLSVPTLTHTITLMTDVTYAVSTTSNKSKEVKVKQSYVDLYTVLD